MLSGSGGAVWVAGHSRDTPEPGPARPGPDATAGPVCSSRAARGRGLRKRGVAQEGGGGSPLSPGRRDAADVPRAPIGGREEGGVAQRAVPI